jgi:UDP-N-acetylmuramoyl-tripeptide--D-alanyl-D-alanine ligase
LIFARASRIGVTGSFGKTSVKFFLTTILSAKYRVLTTPSSFNTPMGLSKVVNESDLSEYDIFVAEMGADHKGDIKYLSKLVNQECGIITAVGIQHLETFGTPQAILKTKLEMFDNAAADGLLIYNYDSQMLRDGVRDREYKQAILSYSADKNNKNYVDVYADLIIHTRNGLEFKAVFKDGKELLVKTELLGRHNVQNLLAAVLAARYYGLSDDEILNGILQIKSVEHRLQRLDSGNGILVLDDAFNSNYSGAVEAVNVLNEIEGGKKIVVTPGFVELGGEEDRYNKMFGEYMSDKISIAILMGAKKTNSIKDGLLNGGFSYGNIFTVSTMAEAQEVLAKLLVKGDVVLFENDLPDVYSEV